jgi:hypothetical protein
MYNTGKHKGGQYCKKQGDSLKYKQLLVDCLDKQTSVMTRGTNSRGASCSFLKAKKMCDGAASYCYYPNARMFKRGSLFCGASTGGNHCKSRCMQMVIGSVNAGAPAFSKAAKAWRCNPQGARGVTCSGPKMFIALCNSMCNANKAVKTVALNLLVSGVSIPYSREAVILKRTSTWEQFGAGPIGPATTVSGRCRLLSRKTGEHRCLAKARKVNAMAVISYYVDSTKVLMCERTGSLAGGMTCRSKKEIQVTGLCLKMEAGCINQKGSTCNTIEDQAYRTGLIGYRSTWKKIKGWKKGMLKQVLPITCCSDTDKGCIKHRLAPWLKKIGYYKLSFSENWSTLGTTDGLGT